MKPILIIQHQENDGPAYLATWLQSKGIAYRTYRSDLEELPPNLDGFSALAVLGGAMSANDYTPAMLAVQVLILQAIRCGIPVAGHCLGGQLLAKALGAKVGSSPQPEVGWHPVEWDQASSEWFGTNPVQHLMQWHYQAFTLPVGATKLAGSGACPVQAFSYGNHIGMQFHIEVDAPKVEVWVDEVEEDWNNWRGNCSTVSTRSEILSCIGKWMVEHQRTADRVWSRWLESTSWKTAVGR